MLLFYFNELFHIAYCYKLFLTYVVLYGLTDSMVQARI